MNIVTIKIRLIILRYNQYMNIEEKIFQRHSIDFGKIENYGFIKSGDDFIFEKNFKDNLFKAVVKISKNGDISGIVYDLENNDEYLPLRIETQKGAYVNSVKEEYEKILKDICENCCIKKFFIYPQSNEITRLIQEKYGDNPEFLWDKFKGYGVFKNPDNNKWYGIIMNIDRSKTDKTKKGEIEIINIKLNENKITELLKREGFYPAWHMNKKSWITIILDKTLSNDEIMEYIEESRNYTKVDKKIRDKHYLFCP